MYPGRVHIADRKDEEEIMELCRQLHRENGQYDFSETKVRLMLHRAFDREGGVLGVIGESGKLEGMIYMLVTTPWYSENSNLEELFAYVAPAYRKSKNAIELMKFAKWCVEQSGLPLLIGVISNERTQGKIRLYKRQFSEPAGTFFYYKANGHVEA